MSRGAGWVPVDRVVGIIESINPGRASSLQYRLDSEDALLEKAQQRMIFGWGGWGRSRITNEDGQDIIFTDGYWIIVIGQGGWVRYLAEFGLLTLPSIFLMLYRRRYRIGMETSVLAIILVGNLIDLIPNAGISPITWMIAGSLWGRLELKNIEVVGNPDQSIPPKRAFSRFGPSVKQPISIDQMVSANYSRQRKRFCGEGAP